MACPFRADLLSSVVPNFYKSRHFCPQKGRMRLARCELAEPEASSQGWLPPLGALAHSLEFYQSRAD